MVDKEISLVQFLKDLMHRRRRLPSQLAADLNTSHATVSRWLSGKDVPNIKSCQKIAEYSHVSLDRILSIAGHLPELLEAEYFTHLPDFREYVQRKYSAELDEDLITMIEDLIERKRGKSRSPYKKRS